MTSWRRALLVWLLIIGAETIHGAFRVELLEPQVGDLRARQICVFSGALIVFGITYGASSWLQAGSKIELLQVGFLWLALTLLFEIGLGRLVFDVSWDRIASDYDLSRGGLLPIGLLSLVLSPLLASRLRARRSETA